MKRLPAASLTGVLLWTAMAAAQKPPDWIAISNGYARRLMAIEMKYAPEAGSREGLVEFDTLAGQPTLENEDAERKEITALIAEFKEAIPQQKFRQVGDDLKIVVSSVETRMQAEDSAFIHKVPFLNPTIMVFTGLNMLLDNQPPVPGVQVRELTARRQAAVARLRKYAGMEEGYQPLTEILKQRIREQIGKPGVVYPTQSQIVTEMNRNSYYLELIAESLNRHGLSGWQEPMKLLTTQLIEYDDWTRRLVLPQGRVDFRLSGEEYASNLNSYGVDVAPDRLIATGHQAFAEIQNEMKPLAEQIARQRKLPSSDYRDVIRELKKEQVIGGAALVLYQERLRQIENLTSNRGILTVPKRSPRIRLATALETALQPAPQIVLAPLLSTTDKGEFVLPLAGAAGFDDFTFDAASWTVIAQQARPGRDLQFESMLQRGVSLARTRYAFNSASAEGWGLYAVSLIMPDMPPEGQLIALNHRLLGAARMFLDPELQTGKIQAADATRVLEQDVVLSRGFAEHEVARYTYLAPGQATSYYHGFSTLVALRKDAETALGRKFNQKRFHDFVLSQGFLRPDQLREAVMAEFVTAN